MQLKLLLLLVVSLHVAMCKIVQVFVLFRHGARTPLSFFYEPGQYTENRGDLTPIGRQQVRDLGHRLRERYVDKLHLISPNYNPHEVYIKSSAKVRTNHSTFHLLEGLFPQVNPSSIKVEYVSTIRDLFYHGHQEESCPLISPLLEALKNSEDYNKASEFYRENLFPNIVKAVNAEGLHNISVEDLNIKKAKKIFDGYKCNLVNGKRNPEFTPNDIDLFYKLNLWHLYSYKFGPKLIQKITNSPIFQEIDRFLDCTYHAESNLRDECPKLVLFSAHDSNIVPFLKSLLPLNQLLTDPQYVPRFAADLLIEVHQDRPHNEPWIKVLYNDKPLFIWGRGQATRIQSTEFREFLQKNILEDIAGICDTPDYTFETEHEL